MEKKKILWLILALVVIFGGGSYLRAKSFRLPVFGPTTRLPPATSLPPPGWEMYSSSFHYSLFYPPDWTPREQGRINERTLDVTSFTVVSEGKKVPLVQVKVSSLPYQEEMTKRDIKASGFSAEGKAGNKVVIGGTEGVRVISKGDGQEETISVFLPGENKTFILLGWPEALAGQNKADLIDQVFSTFTTP